MESAIKLDGISFNYSKKTVISNITFEFGANEVIGIYGQNGVGKSTLLSILAGIMSPSEGRVEYFGLEIKKAKRKFGNFIAYVPQDVVLYETLSGIQNLNFWAGIYGADKTQVKTIIEKLHLADFVNDQVSTYSGGMKRRLNFASSLILTPKIILLDEPTANLDEWSKNKILELIKEYKNAGVCIVIVSHLLDELMQVCDRTLFLKDGTLDNNLT